jgi:hypothetical protein
MVLAVVLSVFSAACYAAAAVVQERLAARGHRGLGRWAGSVGLTLLGATTHTVALGFGTVSVIQALGTLTLLFALPIAAVRTRTPISAGAWRDAGLTVAGLAGIMALATQPVDEAALSADAGRYLLLATAAALVALVMVAWHSASPLVRSVLLAGASGVAFGVSSVVTKAVLADFTVPGATAVVVLAVAGYLLGQASYKGGGLAAPLAMVSVANPVVAATIGVLVLGEGFRFGTLGVMVTMASAVVAGIGVVGLSRRTATTTTTASSSRELVQTGPPSAVTGSSITASTSVVHAYRLQAAPRIGSSTASTSQTWWWVHETGDSTTLAAPVITRADNQSPARASRPARHSAMTAIAPPITRTRADRAESGTSKRSNNPFSDWLPADVM